jgi:hypothetical protein
MSQETKIVISVLDISADCVDEITASLQCTPSRITSAQVRKRREMAWTYDIASGSFSSGKRIENKLNEFLEANAARIRELSKRFRIEVDFTLIDDGSPSFGRVSLSTQTLANIAATGAHLGVGLISAEKVEAG